MAVASLASQATLGGFSSLLEPSCQESLALPFQVTLRTGGQTRGCRYGRSGMLHHVNRCQMRSPSVVSLGGGTAEAAPVGVSCKEVPSPEVLKLWQTAEAVCFDVDSTVCADEGIDELAAFCAAGEAVAAWTARAMGGSVPFEEALEARLALIKPSIQQVEEYLATHPPKLSQGIAALVDKLHAGGVAVFLVSGGFRQMIEPVAAALGIPKSNIVANNILFNASTGAYAGFDPEEFTARSGGKARAIEHIKKVRGFSRVVAVGDGATDLEARRPGGADAFIGYGGVVVRSPVAQQADWFVTDFQALISALDAESC